MKKKAFQLEFICRINGDGSGTSEIKESYWLENRFMRDEEFELSQLSITNDTYIASGFHCFVVRLKKLPNLSVYLVVEQMAKDALTEIHKHTLLCADEKEENIFNIGFYEGYSAHEKNI